MLNEFQFTSKTWFVGLVVFTPMSAQISFIQSSLQILQGTTHYHSIGISAVFTLRIINKTGILIK